MWPFWYFWGKKINLNLISFNSKILTKSSVHTLPQLLFRASYGCLLPYQNDWRSKKDCSGSNQKLMQHSKSLAILANSKAQLGENPPHKSCQNPTLSCWDPCVQSVCLAAKLNEQTHVTSCSLENRIFCYHFHLYSAPLFSLHSLFQSVWHWMTNKPHIFCPLCWDSTQYQHNSKALSWS